MHKHSLKIALTLVVLYVFAISIQPVEAKTDWKQFSANLEKALQTHNLGLQQSAMFLVIKYGDKLDVRGALSDVMKLYQTNKDAKTRELALLTIYRMDREKAMELLNKEPEEDGDFKAFINKRMDIYLSMN